MKHHANGVKETKLLRVLHAYRPLAVSVANHNWKLFYQEKKGFSDFEDVSCIKTELSARYKQTIQTQVIGTLKSYLANVQNRFIDIVHSVEDSIDEQTRVQLFYINKYKLWQHNEIQMQKQPIKLETIKLARHIFKRLTKNKPDLSNCNMVLDKKVCIVTKKGVDGFATEFDYWAKIATLDAGHPTFIPLQSNDHFESIAGVFKNVVQVNHKDGKLNFSLVKSLTHETVDYCTDKLGLDTGMVVMIATEHGDLLGVKLMEKLKSMDEVTLKLLRNLNKQSVSPKNNKRYQRLIRKIRETIKNEVGRIFNQLYDKYKPREIVVEKLNFQGSKLGKQTNRLLGKFGKAIIDKKLDSIAELTGTVVTRVNPAYTSQQCPNCSHACRANRKDRGHFKCIMCGFKMHADVVGGKNISSRSSAEFQKLNAKDKIRQLLAEKHDKWRDLQRGNYRPATDFEDVEIRETVQRKDLLKLS